MSGRNLHLNHTQVDQKPTQAMVGFRPNHSLTQSTTQVIYPKEDSSKNQTLMGIT